MANGWDGVSHIPGRKKLKFLGFRYLKILDNNTLDITGSFTLGFQIQPIPTNSLTYIILSKGHPENLSGSGSIAFESINGFLRVSLCSGNTRVYADTTIPILNSNRIRTVFVTWDNDLKSLKIYLDAVEEAYSLTGLLSSITNINSNSSDLEIGRATGKNGLVGILTDFVYLSRVMSSSEIANYYDSIKFNGIYPEQGTIVFSRYVNALSRYQLFTMKDDGTEQLQLLSSPNSDLFPKWSLDGTRLIYNTWDFNRYPTSPDNAFYNIASNGGDPKYVGGGPYSVYGGWSSDGNAFFQSWGGASSGGNFPKIVDKDTGSIIRYFDGNINSIFDGNALFTSFSPTGDFFIFIRNGATLYRVNLNLDFSYNTNITLDSVSSSERQGNLAFPNISQDGTKITYSKRANTSSPYQIFVMDSNGGNLQQITADVVDSAYSSFSPDGTKILFSRYINSVWQLMTCDVNGTNIRNISNSTTHDISGTWKV